MASPIKYISSFIDQIKNNAEYNIDSVKKEFFNKSIMTKFYENENLLLVYHKYDIPTKSLLENYCRSLVLDATTLNIISYSCQTLTCNKEAQQIILNNSQLPFKYYRCYEGSLLSLFNHNNKWYLSTRRCLDAKESTWNNISHWDMFNSVLEKENITFDDFCSQLNSANGYYFVLIHHNLKNIVDYTPVFGDKYAKLCLAFVRNKETQEEIFGYNLPQFSNIFKSEEISMEQFCNENNKININVDNEGIICKTNIENAYHLLKLQSTSYQFSKAMGTSTNIFKGYIYLYQIGILKEYLNNYNNHKNLEKIQNPYNISEHFDIIGVVDAIFKVLTLELFELFKLLWNFKTKEHQNSELYKILPKEYKDILFGLRGLLFQIKTNRITDNNKSSFGIKNIYNYLKALDVEQICALLRQRKLMFNWIIMSENPIKNNMIEEVNSEVVLNNLKLINNLKLFRKISEKCDKVHSKLIAIYINKLFPDILSSDIP